MLAQAFHKGMIATEGQEKVINDLLGKIEGPLKVKYSDEYKAFSYLDASYENSMVFEEGIAVAEKGGDVNPLTPAVYALHAYNQGDNETFENHVSYLKKRGIKNEEEYQWKYHTGVERFDISGPWVSGISQGIIASVFIRKYKDSGDKEYLSIAKGAIAYCLNEENGLVTKYDEGIWIEEYPSGIGKGVLNGFIFFLIALGELATMGFYEKEFHEGIQTLINELPHFHKGNYILYGKHIPDLGNQLYDKIHYCQLDALYNLTGVSGFYSLKDYWRKISITDFSKS